MGVYRYDYLVLGWKLKEEILDADFIDDLQFETIDSYFSPDSEEFAVYGKILKVSDSITGFDLLEMKVEDTIMYLEDYDKLATAFRDVTSEELLDWTEHEPAKLYLFSILG
jgi:hypothetical protein